MPNDSAQFARCFPKDALMHFGDRDGVDRACVVIFVRRDFGYTWVREHYFGWGGGERYANSSLQIPSLRTHHQRLDVKHSSYPPRPESGGRFEKMGDCFWFYVYFDDLVLNRKSGEFSSHSQTIGFTNVVAYRCGSPHDSRSASARP